MSRDINLLQPRVQELAGELVEKCKNQGLDIMITDTVRTKSEQNALYEIGRTKPGSIVTNAKYPQSNHCWGIAFDFCRNDGKGAYNDSDGFFSKVGKVGKSIGLAWGGNFKSILDKPHFEYGGFGHWRSLLSVYGTPERFLSQFANRPSGANNLIAEYQSVMNRSYGKNLVVDGIYGTNTEGAVVLIRKGSKGDLVTVLQKLLSSRTNYFGGAWDGIFGSVTETAVKRYQNEKGLSVDGIVGKNTWKSLLIGE